MFQSIILTVILFVVGISGTNRTHPVTVPLSQAVTTYKNEPLVQLLEFTELGRAENDFLTDLLTKL